METKQFKTSVDKFRLLEIIVKLDRGNIKLNIGRTDLSKFHEISIIRNILDGLPFGGVVWASEDSNGMKDILFQKSYFAVLRDFYYGGFDVDGVCYSDLKPLLQSRFDDTIFTFRTIWYDPDLNIEEIKNKIELNGG